MEPSPSLSVPAGVPPGPPASAASIWDRLDLSKHSVASHVMAGSRADQRAPTSGEWAAVSARSQPATIAPSAASGSAGARGDHCAGGRLSRPAQLNVPTAVLTGGNNGRQVRQRRDDGRANGAHQRRKSGAVERVRGTGPRTVGTQTPDGQQCCGIFARLHTPHAVPYSGSVPFRENGLVGIRDSAHWTK